MLCSQIRAKCDLCPESGKQQRTATVRREACSVTLASWLFFVELISFLGNLQLPACSANLELGTRWQQLRARLRACPQVHMCLNDVWHGESKASQLQLGLAAVILGWVVGVSWEASVSVSIYSFKISRAILGKVGLAYSHCITVRREFCQWFTLEKKANSCHALISS